ncbi:hypothetical protein BS47DRAFT_1369923 [Hydnum rufescens UP504]|uniref:Uncharacterized protein n=1 Tax=Hydnum rufescens UP504 TaxID=1448309 RepID=A0A9P6ADG7_9AGAM|nr:hypothetical protein BS47DRAFT_1369923 [Hydnum rufescens UP504]
MNKTYPRVKTAPGLQTLVICVKYDELRNTKKVKNIFSLRQPGAEGWAPKGENPLLLRHGQGQVRGCSQGRQPRLGMPPRNADSLSSGSEIPIDPILLSNNDTISLHDGGVMDFSSLHASMGTDTPIEYEIFNGGDPRSTEWRALRIQHLHILVQHLPDVSTIASQGDYLGSYVPQSYEEWRQVFGIDNFGNFLIDNLKFGPAFKDFAKQAFGDRYKAEAALAMFSTGNFKSVRQVACLVSIANTQQMDGLVFWASGGTSRHTSD